ncbi:hydrogenase expression/formation C-terminal domain-containing protein [uncultured Rhodospira sp.]|uniref:hydrogenase expression/formation C-terminal domain-containing protein n=1 Tax=uncultured Rhodospira sp. TaxID=1936189 RepID=UPI00261E95AB|nr:hydrogenase expression/formation C-terminal domain-containing protein [uncultured Rhodospira sp.]
MTRDRLSPAAALIEAEALAARAPEALTLIEAMLAALRTQTAETPAQVFALDDITPDGLRLLDQVLGRGEIAGRLDGPDGTTVTVQESVLTGVWRLHRQNAAGETVARWIEVAAIPTVVAAYTAPKDAASLECAVPADASPLVMPVLTEIAWHAAHGAPDRPNHVINLTLLPLSPCDREHVRQTLGRGGLGLRGQEYGACEIDATALRRVWTVRYLNASDTVVLDTIEIGGVPAAARAATEDFADSAERLASLRDAYL